MQPDGDRPCRSPVCRLPFMSDNPPFDDLADTAAPFEPLGEVRARSTPQALRLELEGLYRSHFRRIAAYFVRCGLAEAVAQELAQDSFVQALRGLVQFDGQARLSTWLWTIARHVLLTHLRRNQSRFDDGPASTLSGAEPVDPDSLSCTPCAAEVVRQDCVRRGFAAFAAAHPERAQVLYLAAVEGWSRGELAELIGRSTHATTEYLSQCRAKLRPYIAHCDED